MHTLPALRTVFTIACLTVAATVRASTAPDLVSGPFPVGFTGQYGFDTSRTFADSPAGDLTGRPVQLRIWYPSSSPPSPPLTYGEVERLPTARGVEPIEQAYRANDDELHRYLVRRYQLGPADETVARLVATPIDAMRDAPPAAQRFPVVLYAGGANFMTDENVLLWRYLASWGYVVIAVPTENPHTVAFNADAQGLEALTRDLEFGLAKSRSMPQADSRHVAAIGFSYGGAAALLMGMRNPAVRAVVGYDASFISQNYGKFLLAAPEFSVDRARFPLLEFHAATSDASAFIVDRLRYAERWSMAIEDADHIDFTSAPLTSFRLVGDRQLPERTLAERAASFVGMAQTTRLFLDHVLKGAPMPAESVREQAASGRTHVSHQAAIAAPPNEAQLVDLVIAHGAAPAIAELDGLLETDPQAAILSAVSVNRMGYALLSQARATAAVDLFLWNLRRHPLEASWFDSLANGYAALGNPACTAAAYRRVLEVLPRDPLDEKEKVALRRTADAYLNKAPASAAYAGRDALHAAAAGSLTKPAGRGQQ